MSIAYEDSKRASRDEGPFIMSKGIVVVCCWLLLLLFAIGYVVFAVGYGCLLVVIVDCCWLLMLLAAGYRCGLLLVIIVCCWLLP